MKIQDSWEEVNGKLIRTYYFDKLEDVTSFVNRVMNLIDKEKIRPEMVIRNDYVKLCISQNEKATDKCHKFALAVDKIR